MIKINNGNLAILVLSNAKENKCITMLIIYLYYNLSLTTNNTYKLILFIWSISVYLHLSLAISV